MERKVIKTKLEGEIIRFSNDSTVVVRVESKYSHPRYEKIIKHHKNHTAHADIKKMELEVGDKVTIESHKPISKRKAWIVISKN